LGARFYYEFAFEDPRKAFLNSVQHDADHLVGFELRDLRIGPWRRFFFEATHTGWVSQEHSKFTTGMTNGGRTLGSALGPDATSLWVRGDLEFARTTISPGPRASLRQRYVRVGPGAWRLRDSAWPDRVAAASGGRCHDATTEFSQPFRRRLR
jgi:hypothetical protein